MGTYGVRMPSSKPVPGESTASGATRYAPIRCAAGYMVRGSAPLRLESPSTKDVPPGFKRGWGHACLRIGVVFLLLFFSTFHTGVSNDGTKDRCPNATGRRYRAGPCASESRCDAG